MKLSAEQIKIKTPRVCPEHFEDSDYNSYHADNFGHRAKNNMPLELYYSIGSAPCRLVLLTGAALGIKFDLKEINLGAQEQFSPEYKKINPQHTIPTLVDNGFILRESRTIARYLVSKYGKGNKWDLYPADLQKRAIVDQMLDFDAAILSPRFGDFFYPQIFKGAPESPELLAKVKEGLKFFNRFLLGQTFAAGDHLTLADLSLVTIITTMEAAGISLEGYDNILRWLELVKKTAPDYERCNAKGAEQIRQIATVILGKKSKL